MRHKDKVNEALQLNYSGNAIEMSEACDFSLANTSSAISISSIILQGNWKGQNANINLSFSILYSKRAAHAESKRIFRWYISWYARTTMKLRRQYTALQVDQLRDHGRHAIGDSSYPEIDEVSKLWLLRYQLKGKRTWYGLGGCNKKTNSLSQARQKASEAKLLIAEGIRPAQKNKADKQAAKDLEAQKKLEANAQKRTVMAKLIRR